MSKKWKQEWALFLNERIMQGRKKISSWTFSGINGIIQSKIIQGGCFHDLRLLWKKELNMISWNGAAEKYDIRDWAPEHEKMGKGITLSQEEAEARYELLGKTLKK